MGVLAFLAGFPNASQMLDYEDYLIHYNLIGMETSPFERGYTYLSEFFISNGLDYQEFRWITVMFSFLLLFIGILFFTKNVSLYVSLYGTTVFFLDAIQVRNLMMISFVILGAGLLTRKSNKLRIIGIISIFISTQFHDIGFLYLVLLVPLSFISWKNLYLSLKPIVIGTSVITVIITISSFTKLSSVLTLLMNKFSSRDLAADKIETIYSRGSSFTRVLLIWLCVILIIYVSQIILEKFYVDNKIDDKLRILSLGSWLSLVSVFLIVLAPDFSRITRNSFIFVILLICYAKEHLVFTTFNKATIFKFVAIIGLIFGMVFSNIKIWGATYYQSIPYIIKIKN